MQLLLSTGPALALVQWIHKGYSFSSKNSFVVKNQRGRKLCDDDDDDDD